MMMGKSSLFVVTITALSVCFIDSVLADGENKSVEK